MTSEVNKIVQLVDIESWIGPLALIEWISLVILKLHPSRQMYQLKDKTSDF